MSYDLRAAYVGDAGAVGAILSSFIDTTPWMPRIHSRAEDISFAGMMIDKGWVTVALQDDTCIGFAAREGTQVHALYVAAQQQRSGAGTALLNDMKYFSPQLDLWTFQDNLPAQAFYLKHGFAEITRTDGARNDEHLPDIRYVWDRKDM
ncbi:MAG: N-acetyltransferase family protein [Paracoccaceae bacterium]